MKRIYDIIKNTQSQQEALSRIIYEAQSELSCSITIADAQSKIIYENGILSEKEKYMDKTVKARASLIISLQCFDCIQGTAYFVSDEEFSGYSELLAKEFCTLFSIILFIINDERMKNDIMEKNKVRSALSTLSYSEIEAVSVIFDELGTNEGVIVASRIAQKASITRSVIVNALRKLESGDVIQSHSLGMKGTYIKVKNAYLLEEIKKFKQM